MSANPFTLELRDGVLQLWLNTPRCEVNVFSRDAAVQLETTLAQLDPTQVQAVVFRSGKRGSFVNGAQLMLANAVHRVEDVVRLTESVRSAYRIVRGLRVPTIAAVQGSCYGCGVEFALHAHFRVAERAFDTHFYMTEIADYLIIPAFGSTQDLPKLVGLENACNLLLWGERWSADQALERGLVDAAFDQGEFETRLAEFVAEVVNGTRKSRTPAPADAIRECVQRTLARIEALPRHYRALYARCFELLVSASAGGTDYEREVQACGDSLLRPMAKSALAFFFVREFAKAKCRRGASDGGELRVIARGLPTLRSTIDEKRPRGVVLLDSESNDPGAFRLAPYSDDDAQASEGEVGVALKPSFAPVSWSRALIAYAPLYSYGVHFFEIAERDSDGHSVELFDLLSRVGFTAVSTRPGSRFLLDELLEAYFAPLRAFVRQGGTKEVVATTLHEFGFVRGPGELAEWLGPSVAPELAGAEPLGVERPALLDAVFIALLDCAVSNRQGGRVAHPSVVDLLAREVLDFPLAHTSLCRYLTRARVAQMLERCEEFLPWVEDSALEQARQYATAGKDFYA